ncbi:MAG TPA: RNA polymerase sigma-70 factor [Gemmatimonadales bacterium]
MTPSRATNEARRLPEEPDWLEAVRAGDASAFEALFHAYHAGLCSFAYRYLGARDLAEEIVQEVFLCVWERRRTWHVRTSVRSYLLTAVRNAALSYLRHERVVRRRRTEISDAQDAFAPSPEVRAMEGETITAVREAIGRLPERCRLVFTLHREQGLTYSEVAEVLGISPRTVEVQIGRALKALRKHLAHHRP